LSEGYGGNGESGEWLVGRRGEARSLVESGERRSYEEEENAEVGTVS